MTNTPTCPCCGQEMEPTDIVVDAVASTVVYRGKYTQLTKKEMQIFNVLFLAYPRIVSKEHIFDAIYPMDCPSDQKILDVFICHLRKKLSPVGMLIATSWGRGFALQKISDEFDDAVEATKNLPLHRWTPRHDGVLQDLVERRFTPQQIAAQMRMPYLAVGKAMLRMGLSNGVPA